MRKAELKSIFTVNRYTQAAEILEISPSALTQWTDPLSRHSVITVLGIAALKRYAIDRETMKRIRKEYNPKRRKTYHYEDIEEVGDEDEPTQ